MRKGRTASNVFLSVLMVASTALALAQSSNQTGKPPVVRPRFVHLVKPDCSAGQSCHGIHGSVVMNVDVLADGTVGEVEATEPGADKRLVDPATAAAKQCRFEPGTFNGKPTSMTYVLKYKF
jgi:TonB family protein